jgi:hypothetical protein
MQVIFHLLPPLRDLPKWERLFLRGAQENRSGAGRQKVLLKLWCALLH